MFRKILLGAAAIAGAIAFIAYVMVGDTGPVGWINGAQQYAFDGYSRKVTMLLLMAVLAAPVALLYARLWPDAPAAAPGAPVVVPKPPRTGLVAVLVFLIGVPLVWAAALGYNAWAKQRLDADAVADYPTVDLAAGTRDAAAGRSHFALRGRVLGEHVVQRTTGSGSAPYETLVPVVERSWREGDPVRFVVRLEGTSLRGRFGDAGSPILVRADGAVPVPARPVFTRMKAPLADDAVLLALVPSRDGKPLAAPAELDWNSALLWGVVGSFSVTLFAIFLAATPWLQRRGEAQREKAWRRAAEKAAAKAAARPPR